MDCRHKDSRKFLKDNTERFRHYIETDKTTVSIHVCFDHSKDRWYFDKIDTKKAVDGEEAVSLFLNLTECHVFETAEQFWLFLSETDCSLCDGIDEVEPDASMPLLE